MYLNENYAAEKGYEPAQGSCAGQMLGLIMKTCNVELILYKVGLQSTLIRYLLRTGYACEGGGISMEGV